MEHYEQVIPGLEETCYRGYSVQVSTNGLGDTPDALPSWTTIKRTPDLVSGVFI